jgi:hypothetical protein
MRIVAIRAAGLLTAALFCLCGCRPAPSPTIVADPALMPLIPADTKVILGVRMKELKKTAGYQALEAKNALPQLEAFTRETGIDPRKDIWEIVVASNGQSAVALVRGKFTEGGSGRSGIEPQIRRDGARKFGYKGYTLNGDENVAVVFFNTSVAVAGPTEAVRRVIDGRDGSRGRPPQDLLDRIARIPSTNQIYAVSSVTLAGALPELPGPTAGLKSMPFDVRDFAGAVDLSSGVRFTSEMSSGTDAMAQKMHDALRGLVGIGRLSTPDGQPEMLRFFDGIEVLREGSQVKVKSEVPLGVFEKFLDSVKDRTRLKG